VCLLGETYPVALSISGREKAIDYLVYEIRQKLSVRTAPGGVEGADLM